MTHIVVYMGGTCGDLVTALLDPVNSGIGARGNIQLDTARSRLKKPHEFANDAEKDQYLATVTDQYASIPSHDLTYHISHAHKVIGITVNTIQCAMWAANRFKHLHRPQVWDQVMQSCGVADLDEYAQMMLDFSNLVVNYTNNVLSLEDILAGNAVEQLQKLTGIAITADSSNFYKQWLRAQTKYETMLY